MGIETASRGIPDIAIVGAGPCGLYGAFYAGLRGMKTLILDSLPALGGQLTAIYPEKYVYDVAGFPKILSKDLAEGLIEQAMAFGPAVALNEKILHIEKAMRAHDADSGCDASGESSEQAESAAGHPAIFRLVSESGREFYAKTVLLALGAGAFLPKKLKLANAAQFEEHGVHYIVNDLDGFNGKRILIVGGGDSAVDWANEIGGRASHTTLVHRHDKWRAHAASVAKLLSGPVDVRTWWELKEIHGEDRVREATIFSSKTDAEETIEVDDIVVCMGFLVDLRFLRGWGLSIVGNAVRAGEKMETSIPGVYVCGDIATHPGKIKLISTGQGEAAVAVNFAYTTLNPDANVFPGHSSNMDLPIAGK